MRNYFDDVVERQQRVALDLSVDVLALRAHCQQLHQVDVVHQRTGRIEPIVIRSHQLQQRLERVPIVVEQQDFLADVDQLKQ